MSTTYLCNRPADVLCVTGADRIDLLHRLSTRDLRPLRMAGQVRQTLFTTQQGKLVDWTRVYALQERLWLVTSPGRAAEVKAWIDKFTIMEDVATEDTAGDLHMLTLIGPDAARLAGLPAMPPEDTFVIKDGGVFCAGPAAYGPCMVAVLPAAAAATLHGAALVAGGTAADDATMERLRLQAGIPGAAHEFREQVNPLELRLTRHAVSWNKGCYIGQEVISRLDSYDKVARVLMGFECDTPLPALPEGQAYKLTADGRSLGRVTSWMPHDAGALGLALVKREGESAAEVLLHGADDAGVPVRLVQRPFFI